MAVSILVTSCPKESQKNVYCHDLDVFIEICWFRFGYNRKRVFLLQNHEVSYFHHYTLKHVVSPCIHNCISLMNHCLQKENKNRPTDLLHYNFVLSLF